MLVTQEFEAMRGEIDQHQRTLWPQDPRRLGNHRRLLIGVVQHLVDHDCVNDASANANWYMSPSRTRAFASPARPQD